MTRFLKHYIRKNMYIYVCIYTIIIITIQEKITLTKFSLRMKFHKELNTLFL